MVNNKKLLVSTKDLIVFLFTIQTICIGWAASTQGSTLSNSFTLAIVAFVRYGVLFVVPFLLFISRRNIDFRNLLLCFIPLTYYLICTFNIYDTSLRPSIIWLLLAIEFFLCNDVIKRDIFKCFRLVLVVVSIYGILVYLSSVISLPFPHTVVDYYDKTSVPTKYLNYFFSYVISQNGLYRLCGFFNEPGYFGTIIALILIVDKINLRKRENIILFIAGCLTLSMAFFLLLLIYLALYSYEKKWPIILLVLLLVSYFLFLPMIASTNTPIGNLIQRFNFVQGVFVGDNRSTVLLDSTFESVLSGPNRFFGEGYGYWAYVRTWGTSSYKSYFVDFGIIGFILMYGIYVLSAIKKGRGYLNCLFYIIVFFTSVYQRPNIFNLLYYLVLFGGIEYQKMSEESN